MIHELTAREMTTGYGKTAIVPKINITIPDRKISIIIGANGCGKSTLLKAFCRLNTVMEGQILLDGKSIASYPAKSFAKSLGLLPQSPIVPEGISVAELVLRGRFPYRTAMRGLTETDYQAVTNALNIMGLTNLADHNVDELSGGQRQRVWIALALAQQTDILFLDEPTTYLDIAYQVEILDMLAELNQSHGTTIVMVLHDINLSARYADHIFAMKKGRLVAHGKPSEVITPKLMQEVYGLNCVVIDDPISGTPLVVPHSRYYSN